MENSLRGSISKIIIAASNAPVCARKCQSISEGKKSDEISNFGVNVNIPKPKKNSYTSQQKEFFKNKIKKTKKTELCKNWELYGNCFFNNTCSFAHGHSELRKKDLENQKYKTKKCKAFKSERYCQFGMRCQYSHTQDYPDTIMYSLRIVYFCENLLKEINKDEGKDFDTMKLIESFKYHR
jgi:hypothetical protein